MGTGIGKYCKMCGEQLSYDNRFANGLCGKCSRILGLDSEENNRKEAKEELLGELMRTLQFLIDREQEKLERICLGEEDISNYVRYIEAMAKRDALNFFKSYWIGLMKSDKLVLNKDDDNLLKGRK